MQKKVKQNIYLIYNQKLKNHKKKIIEEVQLGKIIVH
jgi:hypothetical protein